MLRRRSDGAAPKERDGKVLAMIRTQTSLELPEPPGPRRPAGPDRLVCRCRSDRYPRRSRVIVRSERGLELGEVLASGPGPAGDEPAAAPRRHADGSILRAVTEADELLALRLERNRQAALAACTARLAELGLPVALVDVEHSFDGRMLRFYFLGETTPRSKRWWPNWPNCTKPKCRFAASPKPCPKAAGRAAAPTRRPAAAAVRARPAARWPARAARGGREPSGEAS